MRLGESCNSGRDAEDSDPVRDHAPGPDHSVGQQRGDMPEIGLELSEPEEEQWEPMSCDAPEIDDDDD